MSYWQVKEWREKYCEWRFIDCVKEYYAWNVVTDCGKEIYLTKGNKYGKILKQVMQPNDTTKCPHCQKEINILNYD